jgi:hypothetical protein
MDYAVALSLQPHHYLTCFLPPPPCISKKGRGMGAWGKEDKFQMRKKQLIENCWITFFHKCKSSPNLQFAEEIDQNVVSPTYTIFLCF